MHCLQHCLHKLRWRELTSTAMFASFPQCLPASLLIQKSSFNLAHVFFGVRNLALKNELWRDKEHVHFRFTGDRALLLKLCQQPSLFNPVGNGYLVICALYSKLGRCSSNHTALQVIRGEPNHASLMSGFYLFALCVKLTFTLAKASARNVLGTQQ